MREQKFSWAIECLAYFQVQGIIWLVVAIMTAHILGADALAPLPAKLENTTVYVLRIQKAGSTSLKTGFGSTMARNELDLFS
eukprot:9502429-Pyramimonas_sp.AAC.1